MNRKVKVSFYFLGLCLAGSILMHFFSTDPHYIDYMTLLLVIDMWSRD